MSELSDELRRALDALPREREPDPALEDRVVRAVFSRHHTWMWVAAAAAAALLIVTYPWWPARNENQTYVLLLSPGPAYLAPASGQLRERRAEYGRWADSLSRIGKLELEGHLEPPGDVVDGLFIIRASSDADAARIAATCPHIKYRGHIEVRRFIE